MTQTRTREDRVVTEEPLEIRLQWPGSTSVRAWTTMRTPGHDFELASGWAWHEGWLGPRGPERLAYCTDVALPPEHAFNVVTVALPQAPTRAPEPPSDALGAGSSACGVCGTDTLDALEGTLTELVRPRWTGEVLEGAVARALPGRLREHQALFDRTGGLHAAALATAEGDLLVVREDVGRHNAVDKVAGARILSGETTHAAALVVSGRAGFELVQKAAMSGVGALVAVGAPTSLAVDLARRVGLVLHGFTGPERTVRYA